ncbi:MAG: cobalt-precorrin-5B (C(1))-methyltransferase CbiD [Coriobacteriales bacterium]|jgi:cobalt-precorrin-5B (C1)-methyltransferase
MPLESYVYAGTTRLRRGYTTGTCVALAAKAAAIELLSGEPVASTSLMTPAGIPVEVDVERVCNAGDSGFPGGTPCVAYVVRKDAGDDYDVTDGILVRASVALADEGISIDGGEGVGRVTLPGLDQPVGASAINSGPRAQIAAVLEDVAAQLGYEGGFSVLVEVPGGAEVATKTFNPQLGIEGGISILGTSGIVEPQSIEARKDALAVEIHARAACGAKRLVITPGNYGADFVEARGIAPGIPIVKCANFIGFALDRAVIECFDEVLLVGHIGKLVKVAGGIMDTHSRVADCRCEIFAAHAALAGASREAIELLFEAPTSDACLDVLERFGLLDEVCGSIGDAVAERVAHRVAGAYEVGTVMFSNARGLLHASSTGARMLQDWEVERP